MCILSCSMLAHNILVLMLISKKLIRLTQEIPILVHTGQQKGIIWPCPSSDVNLQGHLAILLKLCQCPNGYMEMIAPLLNPEGGYETGMK